MSQSYLIYACSRANHAHYSSVHVKFCSTSKDTLFSNTWEKTWQVESVEHIEQYHIKFGDKSHNLKQRRRKAFVELLFSWSQFAYWSNGFAHAFRYIIFFLPTNFFIFFSQFRRIICTIFYVIKNVGHHARLRGKNHRTCWGFPLTENIPPCSRTKGRMFLHPQRFQHFGSAFVCFLATNFLLFFPTMHFQNAHFSRVRAFRQEKPPLYFFTNYVLLCAVQDAQCNTEESP